MQGKNILPGASFTSATTCHDKIEMWIWRSFVAAQQKYKLITKDENQVWSHLNKKPQSLSYLLLISQPKLMLISL